MKSKKTLIVAILAALVAALIPAAAEAHPAVRSIIPNKAVNVGTVEAPVYELAPAPESTQYVVSNHSYNIVLRESNGVTDNGILAFAMIPGAWRNQAAITADKTNWFNEAASGAQPHATCSGAPSLGLTQILAWQEADPFYSYIPFQKTSAGLEDDPASWIPVVQAATGFDLSTLPDDPAAAATAAAAACATAGGTYVPADTLTTTGAAFAAGNIAEAVAPLNEQITELNGEVTTLTTERDEAQASLAQAQTDLAQAQTDKAAAETAAADADQRADQAEAAVASMNSRALSVALASKTSSAKSVAVMVSGKFSKNATVKVTISSSDAKRLKTGTTLASGSKGTGKQGSALFGFNAAGKLKSLKGKVKITVSATLDGATRTATGFVTR